MSVLERLMSWLAGSPPTPPRATTLPPVRPDPRILELDKINRDNDARLERLGLSRAVLEERLLAGDTWHSPREDAHDG